MTPIPWTMPPGVYEDMVACLLNHLNRETRRIDGSGGDGGRDVQFELPAGLHIFELKSFNGRMGKGQRRQVVKSLAKAAKFKPVRWELIVPIDPTESELKWFKDLGTNYSFPIEWRGKTWLDTHFAERLFIWRYFCEGAKAEVLDLLREMHKEEAGLANGMPDVIERAKALASRANELDPFFVFKLELDGSSTKISVIPRYEGALEDRPITTQIQFRFDTNTPEGKAKFDEFKLANDFGLPIEIGSEFITKAEVDAPAGLGGAITPSHISLGPGHNPSARPIDVEFLAVSEAGEIVESLTVTMSPENVGKKGVILGGRDRSGLFHAQLILATEHVPNNTNLQLDPGPFVPHELLEAVRLFAALHAPNKMALRTASGMLSAEPIECPEQPPVDPILAEFVANLAMIQGATGIVREVEGHFGPRDFSNASAGAALARGEEAQMAWTSLTLRWSESPKGDQRRSLTKQPLYFRAEYEGPAIVPICGTDYPIGRRRSIELVGHLDPKVTELLRDEDAEVTEVVLHPEPDTHMKVRILSR
jgi:hypothetical protein